MTQDRSTPLESVVEEARAMDRHVHLTLGTRADSPADCAACLKRADLLTRLADRVEEDRETLAWVEDNAKRMSEGRGGDRVLDSIAERARQALSTQPHHKEPPHV